MTVLVVIAAVLLLALGGCDMAGPTRSNAPVDVQKRGGADSGSLRMEPIPDGYVVYYAKGGQPLDAAGNAGYYDCDLQGYQVQGAPG